MNENIRKELFKKVKEKFGSYTAESFCNFAETNPHILQKLSRNLSEGVSFCLEIVKISKGEKYE